MKLPLILTLALALSTQAKQLFKSTTVVQVHPSMIAISPENPENLMTANYMEKEFKSIVAPATLKIAAQTLNLDLTQKDALKNLKAKITTKPRRGTDFIEISAVGTTKEDALNTVNAITNAYIKRRTAAEVARAEKALAALDTELITQSDLVVKNRKELTNLIQKFGIPYFDDGNQNPPGKTEEEMFRDARQKLAQFEVDTDNLKISIKKLAESPKKDLIKNAASLDIPQNNVPVYAKELREAKDAKFKMLAQGLAETHPDIVALDQRAETAMKNAHKEVISLEAILKTHLELLNIQIKKMKEMVEARDKDTIELSLKQAQYKQAKEAYEQTRSILRDMMTKQQEARLHLKAPRAPITIHERAK